MRLYAKENGLFTHNAVVIAATADTEQSAGVAPLLVREGNEGKPMTFPLFDGQCATPNPDAKRLAPAVIEGSAEFLLVAAEALLQSFDGVIRLFPGVPDDFTGWFHGFRAANGLLVSAEMRDGRLRFCRLASTRDTPVPYTVRCNDAVFTGLLQPMQAVRLGPLPIK